MAEINIMTNYSIDDNSPYKSKKEPTKNFSTPEFQEKLEDIKKNIEEGYTYFRDNIERYKKNVHFICVDNLGPLEYQSLNDLKKPAISFNIIEAKISKLRSIFMTQEPSITVRATDGMLPQELTKEFIDRMELLEGYYRELLYNPQNDRFGYQVWSDLLIGGWSVARVSTDYRTPRSFEQNIMLERRYPPFCVFDPAAQESHKGDGQWASEIIPMTKEELTRTFGKEAAKNISFTGSGEGSGFNWSYNTGTSREIAMVGMYYDKKVTPKKILQLATGKTMDADRYPEFLKEWKEAGIMAVPPKPVADRWTDETTICVYTVCEGQILNYEETVFDKLPLVFIDGNSVISEESVGGTGANLKQVTRSWAHHAVDTQKLKNFAGQTLGNELENMVMHKFMISVEAIPDDKEFQRAYQNYQKPNTMVWQELYKQDPNIRLSPPQPVARVDTPPIVMETFLQCDRLLQTITGDYDDEMAMNSRYMSGEAFKQGALQTSQGASPWLVGYFRGLDRIAQVILPVLPKILKGPRHIPVRKNDGTRSYELVNNKINKQPDPNSIQMQYDADDMLVTIEAGPSVAVQKQLAVQQISNIMNISPLINEFFSTDGASVLMDNIEFRGSDRAKAIFEDEFLPRKQQEMEAQGQQQQEIAQLEKAKLMAEITGGRTALDIVRETVENQDAQFVADYIQNGQEDAQDVLIEAAEVAIDNKKADAVVMLDAGKLQQSQVDQLLKAEQIDAEKARTEVELTTALSSDAVEWEKHKHEVSQANRDGVDNVSNS